VERGLRIRSLRSPRATSRNGFLGLVLEKGVTCKVRKGKTSSDKRNVGIDFVGSCRETECETERDAVAQGPLFCRLWPWRA
jgi:hypothetical protein